MSAPVSVSEGAPDLAATEQVADELVASFDKPTDALAAVLLAADRGYDFEQIAATDGVLQADGQIVDADGGQLLPRYEPSELCSTTGPVCRVSARRRSCTP